jgi:hypothetical protein
VRRGSASLLIVDIGSYRLEHQTVRFNRSQQRHLRRGAGGTHRLATDYSATPNRPLELSGLIREIHAASSAARSIRVDSDLMPDRGIRSGTRGRSVDPVRGIRDRTVHRTAGSGIATIEALLRKKESPTAEPIM